MGMPDHRAGVEHRSKGELRSKSVGGRSAFRRPSQVIQQFDEVLHAVSPENSPYPLCDEAIGPLALLDQPETFEKRQLRRGFGAPEDCAACVELTSSS
ncbi:hypothetical protein CcI49_28435 [Frankia sp. CcI49]|uniref:hypothetical protein n=1 Tax=Frankia sp. CcI49 TaxID=1745382 RepID=UPI0009C81B08|nr:hypothetical protein [Frankia sp. CcI49]ONH55454.1 hypothetical protein CcI49_28435 [Frankia sp. CcI49]